MLIIMESIQDKWMLTYGPFKCVHFNEWCRLINGPGCILALNNNRIIFIKFVYCRVTHKIYFTRIFTI